MKVELYKVMSSYGAFNSLFQEKMKGALAFKVLGILKESENHIKKYEETRVKILKDNGISVDENGKAEKIEDKELEAELNKEVTNIANSEIDFHARPLTLDDLDKLDLSPEQVMLIEWAIDNGDNS